MCPPTRWVRAQPCPLVGLARCVSLHLVYYCPVAQVVFFHSQYVLAVGSSVFYAMFYGNLAEVKSEIHIPDVEPAAFLVLLK